MMRSLLLCAALAGLAFAEMPAERRQAYIDALSKTNSQQPEWHLPHGHGYEFTEEGAMRAIRAGIEAADRETGLMGGRDRDITGTRESNKYGGTSDIKDQYVHGEFNNGMSINMTPYVIQTKDERWQAGVPNFEQPDEGYSIRSFDDEAEARAWVINKSGSDLVINYPLAPDVDPENNPANPLDPNDKNPNTMQDNAPKDKPKVQMGHLEPAYIGEYDEQEIFGDYIRGDDHVAHGEDHGDLQDAIYLERGSSVRSKLKARRAFARGERVGYDDQGLPLYRRH